MSYAQEATLNVTWDRPSRMVTWTDITGEAWYHASGTIVYLAQQPCLSSATERISIDQELPADSTSYQLPSPSNSALTLVKDVNITVEALDSAGRRIGLGGFAIQGDPFCTPDEIAAELAAAGSGPASTGAHRSGISALLLTAGVAAIAASAALGKKARGSS